MTPTVDLRHGDCLDVLKSLPDESVHAVITDPPYGLANTDATHVVETLSKWFAGERDYLPSGAGFMGKAWDAFVPPPAVWDECYRVLKPGGHLLAFAGSRTQDLMGMSIRLAGFDLRDTITWLYGSGFPKSLDVGKAIDKVRDEDVEPRREVCRQLRDALAASGKTRSEIDRHFGTANVSQYWFSPNRKPEVPPADKWPWLREFLGLGSALDAEVWRLNRNKGEPGADWLSRKVVGSKAVTRVFDGSALVGGKVRAGAIDLTAPATPEAQQWHGWGTALKPASEPIVVARKPLLGTVAANVLAHGTGALNIDACRTGGPKAARGVRATAFGMMNDDGWEPKPTAAADVAGRWPANVVLDEHAAAAIDTDSSEVSRFFPVFKYQAKAPTRERPKVDGVAHPTVKPLDLMRWLVRLVTPPGGTVLEPFAGSGTTVEAALLEGMDVIAVEREADYLPLIQQRIDRAAAATQQVDPEPEGLW